MPTTTPAWGEGMAVAQPEAEPETQTEGQTAAQPEERQQPHPDYRHQAAVAWVEQGAIDEAHGDLDAADAAYTKALSLEPGNIEARQRRRAERDRRIAKADRTIAPIKRGQIAARLAVLSNPIRLARAQAVIARLGGERPSASSPAISSVEIRQAMGALTGLSVAPRGAVSPQTLRQAKEIIARAVAAAGQGATGPAVSAAELRFAKSVIARALAQPGTTMAAGGQTVIHEGASAMAFQAEVSRVQALLASLPAAFQGGTAGAMIGADTGGGGSWPALGQLKTAIDDMGSAPGVCFDVRCTSAVANLPRAVAVYGGPPPAPPQERALARQQEQAIQAAEADHEQAVAKGTDAEAWRKQLEQHPVIEPDPYERSQAIQRASGEAANNGVKALEDNANVIDLRAQQL